MVIATIDFDIIMAPSIQLYNTLVPAQNWDKLTENPHFQLCMADTNIYEKIFKYIMKCVKCLDQSHIHFIDSHDKVLSYINEKSDIINIDYHHDIGYGNDPNKPDLTCADWVSYLYNEDKLNSYTWIRNINSELPEGKWDYIDYNEEIIQEYNIFIGEAKTIKQIKETMEKINVSVDTEHNLFIEHDYVKNGKILLIEDEDFKKQILIDKGIIKG